MNRMPLNSRFRYSAALFMLLPVHEVFLGCARQPWGKPTLFMMTENILVMLISPFFPHVTTQPCNPGGIVHWDSAKNSGFLKFHCEFAFAHQIYPLPLGRDSTSVKRDRWASGRKCRNAGMPYQHFFGLRDPGQDKRWQTSIQMYQLFCLLYIPRPPWFCGRRCLTILF